MPTLARALILIVVALAALPARAESFRTLVMIDASSSMRRTDPQKLRKVAAELYVDLARDGDAVAVSQFHSSATDVSSGFQRITGPEVRDRLKDAIRAVGDDGQWTDFGAAFQSAAEAFRDPPAAGEKRFLVFLTDGRCEPDPAEPRYIKDGEKPDRSKKAGAEREERCKQLVLSEALAKLHGVEPVVIGLSRGAPRDFLDEVARRGSGRSMVTERAEDLPHLFAKIHADNSGSRVAPLQAAAVGTSNERAFVVDPVASSFDLVAVVPANLRVDITLPDGTVLDPQSKGIYAVHHERYRFWHIRKPAPGTWRLRHDVAMPTTRKAPPITAEVIQNYDLALRLEAPANAELGHPILVKALLAAGDAGALPDESFLARHQFFVDVKADGATRTLELAAAPDGARVGKIATTKQGNVELVARVAPGPDGALTRVSGQRIVSVVPPLKVNCAALALGDVKPGTTVKQALDLRGSEFLGEVTFKVAADGMPFTVDPRKLKATLEEKRFDLEFELPGDAAPGPVAGALVLTPATAPYEGREGTRIPVAATILPLTFWEKHGGKVSFGLLVLMLGVVVAGFKLPARFPAKLRVFYVDKTEGDEGDYGLAIRGKPGFFKPGIVKVGGGGPIRRTSRLVCEIVAAPDGVRIRPAPGRTLKSGDDSYSREFRPGYGVKYEADEGLTLWIGKEEEEE